MDTFDGLVKGILIVCIIGLAITGGKQKPTIAARVFAGMFVFVFLGLLLMAAVQGIGVKVQDVQAKKDAVFLTATIVHYEVLTKDTGDGSTSETYYVYKYEVDGTEYLRSNKNQPVTPPDYSAPISGKVTDIRVDDRKIGSTVEIYYPTGQPQNARPVDQANSSLQSALIALGIFFIFARPFMKNRPRKKAAVSLEKD